MQIFGRNSDITAKNINNKTTKTGEQEKNYTIFSICSLLYQFVGLLQHVHISFRPRCGLFSVSTVHISCAYIQYTHTWKQTLFACSCLVKLALNSTGNYRVNFVSWALLIWKYHVCTKYVCLDVLDILFLFSWLALWSGNPVFFYSCFAVCAQANERKGGGNKKEATVVLCQGQAA